MNYGHDIISTDLVLSEHIVNFFIAQAVNPAQYQSILDYCLNTVKNANDPQANSLIGIGFLSKGDLIGYFSTTGIFKGSYNDQLIDIIIKGLVNHYIIEPLPDWRPIENIAKRFKVIELRAVLLHQNGLIFNLLCGWQHIINKYSDSILKIENLGLDDRYDVGTGFYHEFMLSPEEIKYVVITNKHVLEKYKALKLYTKEDSPISYEQIVLAENRDLGFLILKGPLSCEPLKLALTTKLISEIITIGYPSVPMTRSAYQLVHKGEVNAFVKDYDNNDFILFSAKTSSGNSGSPLLDSAGLVVGVVTQELFEKQAFFEKGKPPYFAAIPTLEIINALNSIW